MRHNHQQHHCSTLDRANRHGDRAVHDGQHHQHHPRGMTEEERRRGMTEEERRRGAQAYISEALRNARLAIGAAPAEGWTRTYLSRAVSEMVAAWDINEICLEAGTAFWDKSKYSEEE